MMQLPGDQHGAGVRAAATVRAAVERRTSSRRSWSRATTATNYGKLVLYQMPDRFGRAVARRSAASLIEADPIISKQFSLLDQRGSSVVRGDAQLIPIGNSIFYVRPIYVEGKGSRRSRAANYVAVTYGENAVLDQVERHRRGRASARRHDPLPSGGSTTGERHRPPPTTTTTTPHDHAPTTQPPRERDGRAAARAGDQLFDAGDQALAEQDLATYAGRRTSRPGARRAGRRPASRRARVADHDHADHGSTTTTTSPPATTTTAAHA